MSYKDLFLKNNDFVQEDPKDDWHKETCKETIIPTYNDGNKEYNISMANIINGINNSSNKLDGNNVWLPDKNGELISLPNWVADQPGAGNNPNNYRLEMISTQGTIIKDKKFTTVLKAIVYENNENVTDIKEEKYFKWSRFSGATEQDQILDAEWNYKWASGAKEIPITNEDVNRNAMFQVQFVTEQESEIWEKAAYEAYIHKIKMLTRRRE